MKNILSKIYIHPFTFFVAFICLITGYIKNLVIFTSIIIIHELGHIFGSQLFNWNIDKIVIMPFGGITIFNEKINKPQIEELVVLLLGPLFQLIFFILLKGNNSNFDNYNYGLFIFNFLPIYPLDGYKFLCIIMYNFLPFKIVNRISLIISLISILFFLKFDIIHILIVALLLKGIVKEYYSLNYSFNKFLLERCKGTKSKKTIIVSNINHFYKNKKHLIKINNKLYTEMYILNRLFKGKR